MPLLNGFDTNGGRRPREVHWRWDAEKPDPDHAQRGLNCRVWLGSAAAGLQLNLQGIEQVISLLASYHLRLQPDHVRLQPRSATVAARSRTVAGGAGGELELRQRRERRAAVQPPLGRAGTIYIYIYGGNMARYMA